MSHETEEREDIGFLMAPEYGIGRKPHVFPKVAYGTRANFAMAFCERWGMVAAVVDGEDSAGRQKLRLATVEELVDRACQVSELLCNRIDELGWSLDLPDPELRPEREK